MIPLRAGEGEDGRMSGFKRQEDEAYARSVQDHARSQLFQPAVQQQPSVVRQPLTMQQILQGGQTFASAPSAHAPPQATSASRSVPSPRGLAALASYQLPGASLEGSASSQASAASTLPDLESGVGLESLLSNKVLKGTKLRWQEACAVLRYMEGWPGTRKDEFREVFEEDMQANEGTDLGFGPIFKCSHTARRLWLLLTASALAENERKGFANVPEFVTHVEGNRPEVIYVTHDINGGNYGAGDHTFILVRDGAAGNYRLLESFTNAGGKGYSVARVIQGNMLYGPVPNRNLVKSWKPLFDRYTGHTATATKIECHFWPSH